MWLSLSLLLHVTFLFVSLTSAVRKVSIYVNPDCGSLCENEDGTHHNLVHVRADGDNDTIHYLWSSIGSFSFLIAKTDLESELRINWNRTLSLDPSSITFSRIPDYTSSAVFTRLWSYEDVNDDADVSAADYNLISVIPFYNLTWESVTATNVSDVEVRAEFALSTDLGSVYGNRTLRLVLGAFGDTDHYDLLPKLIHTPSSLQIELILDNFVSNYTTKGRFALEVALISNESAANDYLLNKLVSIDDEYTPGVFTTVQITSPMTRSNGFGCYVLWKPVCYTSSDRTTEFSTNTKEQFGNVSLSSRLYEMSNSIANAYYGSDLYVSFVNVSFGLEDDGFYEATNYLSWTATFGVGAPPVESFSTLIIAVIIVGFGIPALLIIVGGIFIVVRRFRTKGDELRLNIQSSKVAS